MGYTVGKIIWLIQHNLFFFPFFHLLALLLSCLSDKLPSASIALVKSPFLNSQYSKQIKSLATVTESKNKSSPMCCGVSYPCQGSSSDQCTLWQHWRHDWSLNSEQGGKIGMQLCTYSYDWHRSSPKRTSSNWLYFVRALSCSKLHKCKALCWYNSLPAGSASALGRKGKRRCHIFLSASLTKSVCY